MNLNNPVYQLHKELGKKKGVTELIINNFKNIYIERNGELIRLNVELKAEDITSFCSDIAALNKSKFDMNHPIIDGTLEDGSRVNIISSLYTGDAPAITIRRYLTEINSFDNLDGKFSLSDKWITFLKSLVYSKQNIIVSGGTGVGKTTFLNLLLQEISPTERVITIEDTKELVLKIPNQIRLVAKSNITDVSHPLSTRELLKNTLRMRPDRIIIGEVRAAEAFDLLQLMNTGHDGSMCTVHANGAAEALSRIENLFLMSGYDVPQKSIRQQISTAIDFVIQLKRDRDGNRVISSITEISSMEGDIILTQEIANHSSGGPVFTGLVPRRLQELKDHGVAPEFFLEI